MTRRISLSVMLLVALLTWGASGCDKKSSSKKETTKSAEQPQEKADEPAESTDDEQEAGDKKGEEGPSLADIPSDQSRTGLSENEKYYVELVPQPNPVPFQELFDMVVVVRSPDDRESPLEGVSLDEVRATMPAHDHGMKTEPEVKEEGPGSFKVEGMKFHMQGLEEDGRWVIHLVINGEAGIDEAKFDLQCCKPTQ